ncbi:(2Fe-2S)-binding protein [Geodermatophilus sp. CPCC 206100]|uniref:(2Fe-2S)-binding protein n=1 Tax=Geodermatophilus sp. CPCC 206100 TaxID=3020054 RepID=UPI003AFF72BF
MRHQLTVNGELVDVEVAGLEPLSTVLRGQLGLTATKVACGRGECGACTVLVDGGVRMSCTTPAALVRGAVWTSEGLADQTRDLRAEFADRGAFQCGFCTPGQVVSAQALLREGLPADDVERRRHVRHRLSGNICRCTGYQAIVDAVCAVADRRATEPA